MDARLREVEIPLGAGAFQKDALSEWVWDVFAVARPICTTDGVCEQVGP